ncbi:MAG: hypothetical protein HFE39_08985 [Clostridiales bacterium]|jgi:hypothetical protein|nr:hypothetical protein [Clostridiales bacterium]
METKNLSKKELLFCRLAAMGDPESAARQAGYRSSPQSAARRLMERKEILEEIGRVAAGRKEERDKASSSRMGYERLAFGSIADAVKLLYLDEPSLEELSRMDFFQVSEIRRPKDGAMEIKFFDRMRALERLEQSEREEDGELSPFYRALEQGAQALNQSIESSGDGEDMP